MPEAPVDENDLAALSKNNVGVTGQILRMKAVPIAEGEDELANE